MKRVMKQTILTATCFVVALLSMAQPPQGGDKREKIEALRIAFISERLNLTPEEAQKFWPVYNQYQTDLKSLRDNFGMGPGKPQLTADQALDFDQKKLDLKKKYKAQFETVIGKEKVNTLYNLEEEFRRKLQEMREQRKQNQVDGQGPPSGGKF